MVLAISRPSSLHFQPTFNPASLGSSLSLMPAWRRRNAPFIFKTSSLQMKSKGAEPKRHYIQHGKEGVLARLCTCSIISENQKLHLTLWHIDLHLMWMTLHLRVRLEDCECHLVFIPHLSEPCFFPHWGSNMNEKESSSICSWWSEHNAVMYISMLFFSFFLRPFIYVYARRLLPSSTAHRVRLLQARNVNCAFSHLGDMKVTKWCTVKDRDVYVTSRTATWTGVQKCTWNNTLNKSPQGP